MKSPHNGTNNHNNNMLLSMNQKKNNYGKSKSSADLNKISLSKPNNNINKMLTTLNRNL